METTVFLVLLSLTTMTIASPLNKLSMLKDKPLEEESLSETLKATLGKFHNHLLSRKQYFTSELEQDGTLHHKVKRETGDLEEQPDNSTVGTTTSNSTVNATATEELTFEDYEKKFLINQTMNLLKQLLLYKEYTKSLNPTNANATKATTLTPQNVTVTPSATVSTTDGNRVDAALDRKLRELSQMSVIQLDKVFHNVRNAARRGSEDISISSLCCSI